MAFFDRVQEACVSVQSRTELRPRVGVVLGSGLGAFVERLQARQTIPYAQLPFFPKSTVAGHAGEWITGASGGVPVAVMSGRVHYYEGYSMQDVTFGVRLMAALGISTVVLTNAAGGIHADLLPGSLMLLRDHINLTGDNPLRGPHDERLGARFPDMTDTYGAHERALALHCAKELAIVLREGVYAGLAGPSYETPAEICMLRTLGADAVGMSTVAEAIAARHGGLRVIGISVITNQAAGISGAPLSHQEVQETGQRVASDLCRLLESLVVATSTLG